MSESILVLTHADETGSALTKASLEVVTAGKELAARLGMEAGPRPGAPKFLTAEQASQFLLTVQVDPRATVMQPPRVTLCSGQTGTFMMIVLQLGLAMMPMCL